MKYEELKDNGKLIENRDWTENGLYLYTSEFYEMNNSLYRRDTHPNTLKYTGETRTHLIFTDLLTELKTTNAFNFNRVRLSDEGYAKLCEMHNIKPCFPWENE
jgi:hypothetical protein